MTTDEDTIINRVSAVGIFGNVFLSLFKFVAGIIGNSGAMVADAIHSMSDVVATVIAYIGTKLGRSKADREHPYGHERIETLAALILGAVLIVTALLIVYGAVMKIVNGSYRSAESPGIIALIAAVASIALKEAMYRYTMHYAKILNSDAFKADAWHHRSDAVSSVAALIGIAFAMSGFPIMEPIATAVIGLFIIWVAVGIINDSVKKIIDTSCDDATEESIRKCAESVDGVIRVDLLRTRLFGNRIYVDIEIAVDGDLSVRDGHVIAEKVHDAVEGSFCDVKHVMVHVNPD